MQYVGTISAGLSPQGYVGKQRLSPRRPNLDNRAVYNAYTSVHPYVHTLEVPFSSLFGRGMLAHEAQLFLLGDNSHRHDVQKIRCENRFQGVGVVFCLQPVILQV